MRRRLLASTDADAEGLPGHGSDALPGVHSLRLRGGAADPTLPVACCGCCLAFVCVISFFCISTVDPTEYGILKNSWTGAVSNTAVRGGIYFVKPYENFITFPATQVTVLWSQPFPDIPVDAPQIASRTGGQNSKVCKTHEADDFGDSGGSSGQSLYISCSLQFEYVQERLPSVYFTLLNADIAKERFVLVAGTAVSNTVQEFHFPAFWKNRACVAAEMLKQINSKLTTIDKMEGAVRATAFQILKVDFTPQFEDRITETQVQIQMSSVNTFAAQVQYWSNRITVAAAETQKNITEIMANATRTATVLVGETQKQVFNMKTAKKAEMYSKLQRELGLSSADMAEYMKIKALLAQAAKSEVVVNIPPPTEDAAPSSS